ncbi:MAG: hypothetical protein IJU76_10825 [Desulfovibrionaceae bacterium]|nr:hypothetical protein [Desulfovibrionaceae bacterium]
MSQINGATQASQVSDISKISERNPQLALAMLMMDIAKLNKDNATGMISDIEKEQGRKKEASDMLNKARDYKQSGLHLNDAGIPSGIDENFIKFCKDNGVTIPHYQKYADSKEKLDAKWDNAIAQLQTKLDTIGSDIQTQMVKMQDMMGQFNSMMQGANSAISQANQVLQSVAKGG